MTFPCTSKILRLVTASSSTLTPGTVPGTGVDLDPRSCVEPLPGRAHGVPSVGRLRPLGGLVLPRAREGLQGPLDPPPLPEPSFLTPLRERIQGQVKMKLTAKSFY